MMTIREQFGLTEYSDEFVNKIIDYRMHIYKNKESWAYYTYEEIAEKENCNVDDVRKILDRTSIIWNH